MATARQAAFDVLLKMNKGAFSNVSLDAALSSGIKDARERALASVLVYGVTERRLTLDALIKPCLDRPMKKMKADVQKVAQHFEDKLGSSDAVDALAEKVDTSLINGMNSQAKTLMELRAKANVENEFNAKTEEEKFLWRMEEAKRSGQLAEFRIAEARSMLITTTEQIKSSFREFKGIFENSFKNSFFDLLNKLTGIIKINFYPETIYDRSDNEYNISKITNNGTLYEIMPINKEDFAYTVNQLTTLAQASVDTLAKQNAVLGEIKELLAEGQPPVIMPPAEETKPVVPNESRHRMSMSLDNERKRSFSWFSSSIFGSAEASSGS